MRILAVALILAAALAAEISGKAIQDQKPEFLKVLSDGAPRAQEKVPKVVVKANDTSPCVYKGRFFTIDVRNVLSRFNGQNFSVDFGKYIYTVSFCSPINCSFPHNVSVAQDLANAAACQYISSQMSFVKLGDSSSVKFNVANLTHFNMVFSGGNPDPHSGGRSVQVNFVASTDCSRVPTLEFTGEEDTDEGITYVFTVQMRMDEEKLLSFYEKIEL